MEQLRIAQVSDLHVLKDYRNSMFDRLPLLQTELPANYVQVALREIAEAKPDILVLTGDLVHEGSAEDYRFLKMLIDRYCDRIPVLPVLGNHDLKQSFYRGYLNEDRTGRYYYKHEQNGYRFLVIDTAVERNGCGDISSEQIDWLEQELSHASENGTILLGHHPLQSRQAWFHTDYDARLGDILEKSDVIAYLCGHAHYAEDRTICGIRQITAESCAFGVETVSDTDVIYTHTRGYNTCWLENREIIVHQHQMFPVHPQICRFAF